jgi:hypothetical protein
VAEGEEYSREQERSEKMPDTDAVEPTETAEEVTWIEIVYYAAVGEQMVGAGERSWNIGRLAEILPMTGVLVELAQAMESAKVPVRIQDDDCSGKVCMP